MYIKNSIGPRTVPWGTPEDRMGGGLRPFGNNSLRSSLQKMLDPVMQCYAQVFKRAGWHLKRAL